MKKITAILLTIVAAVVGGAVLTGCESEADVSSYNISQAADNFEIQRRIVFFNGITDTYLLTIEGRCSITDEGNQLEVTCKIDRNNYKKHFLGLSDNVSYFIEQIGEGRVSGFRNRVIFRPETILPDIDIQTSGNQADPTTDK